MDKDSIPLPADRHPVQDVYHDEHGVIRFRPNKIVRDLLDFASNHGFDLNVIAVKNYTDADRVQFSQLCGYSVAGFSELTSYVSDEDYAAAMGKVESRNGECELKIRNQYLRDKLEKIREGMRLSLIHI